MAQRYQTLEVPEAEHLVVLFPKLRQGGAPPQKALARGLLPVHAHQLRLASDPDWFVGPRRSLRGFSEAVDLIGTEADRLGVPAENVACVGTSHGAILALAIGLRFGRGLIVAGGAPVRMGTALLTLARYASDDVARFGPEILALAETGDGTAQAFLDAFIFDLAAAVTAPMRVELVGSTRDPALDQMRELHAALEHHPTIASNLTYGDYGTHGEIGDAFVVFALGVLGALCGVRGR